MALRVAWASSERLVGAEVCDALAEGVRQAGASALFVPSFAQALEAQRALAEVPGLSLDVTVTTPAAWVKERWELWGDGRAMADDVVLTVLARETLLAASAEERGPIELSLGMVRTLSALVGLALPWLPLDEGLRVVPAACAAAGLTHAETLLVGLAGALARRLRERGYVAAAEASALVPTLLERVGAALPQVVVAGFASMPRHDRELMQALAELTQVCYVARVGEGPAYAAARALAEGFGGAPCAGLSAPLEAERAEELTALLRTLFSGRRIAVVPRGAVELAEAAGPLAEAELVAARVRALACELGRGDGVANEALHVAIVASDVPRAVRELVPKLAAHGFGVRAQWSRALYDAPATQAFFGFARTVARLAALDATWPAPELGLEGPVARLGDMSWWPPRELTDFLLSDIAHTDPMRAWRLDAAWRGDRLLTPGRVLKTLQSEQEVSGCVARATAELLLGRIGSAASKLLAPYVLPAQEDDASGGDGEDLARVQDESADEARACLQAILGLAGTLRELGVTADASQPGAVSLAELVNIAEWAAQGVSLVARTGVRAQGQSCEVLLVDAGQARLLPAASLDALVLCGLTTAERPITPGDGLLPSLLELLGVEPMRDPMAEARAEFHALVALPTRRLMLERALRDADSKPTYPSVMLSELMSCYEGEGAPLDSAWRVETELSANLSAGGVAPERRDVAAPAPAGMLTDRARGLVFVPQDGSAHLPGGKPVLSASQVETYLECPYKWFSLRRLRLGTVDAGHGGVEMGSFAHRVLEVTHRELLARALEAERPGVAREELLTAIEVDPARHVASSRVEKANLEVARRALELEFDLHSQHMRMVRRGTQAQQLLVPHDSAEAEQEERLREDLLSALGYQTRILAGFEPRLFEWGFGRHGAYVDYAGAYFTGTVDRIDVSPHGTAVIIDYKHKAPAGFTAEYDALQEGVLEGKALPNRVQSLIYAQVVRRAFEGRLRLVGTVYLSTRSPHAMAGAADENVADQVFGRLSPKRAPRVCVPAGSGGGSGMEALLDRTEELVAKQVARMLAGHVEARPRDAASCDFCPVMQCERRRAR